MAKGSGTTKYQGSSASSAANKAGGGDFSKYDRTDYQGNVIKAIYAQGTPRVIGSKTITDAVVYEDGSSRRAFSAKSKTKIEELAETLKNDIGGFATRSYRSGGVDVIEVRKEDTSYSKLDVYGTPIKPRLTHFGADNYTNELSSSQLKEAIRLQRWAANHKFGGTIIVRSV